MKFLSYVLFLIVSFSLSAQSNCRSLIVKDSENNTSANITCDYPFNSEGCISLHAEYTQVKATNDYDVSSINYNPYGNYDSGTLVNIASDDKFSPIINLPFTFCYYGISYDKVVISDNGLVSFDLSLAQGDAPYYSSPIPNPALYNKSIFALYHDITNDNNVFGCTDNPNTGINECGEIRYDVIGSEPCRKFVVNYNALNHFNDESSKSTFQLVLFEGSNEIEVHILKKPINTETSLSSAYRKNATIGIQDHTGLKAVSPDGRDNKVFAANNESWKFSPNGDSVVKVFWYNEAQEVIGMGDSISVCTTEATTITAEAVYDFCAGHSQSVNDSFQIQYDDSYPKVTSKTFMVCDTETIGSEEINVIDYANQAVNHTNYTKEIYGTQEDANNGINALQNLENYTLSGTQTFWIKLFGGEDCFDIDKINIKLVAQPSLDKVETTICDLNNDSTETITLSTLNNHFINGGQPAFSVIYFNSLTDAQNNSNPITEYTFTQSLMQLYIKLQVEGSCSSIETVTINLKAAPNIPSNLNVDICENVTKVNLNNYIPDNISISDYTIYFFRNLEDANNNTNPINNSSNFPLNGIAKVYLKVMSGADCYSIMELSFNYLDAIEAEDDVRVQCDSDVSEDETFDLSLSIPDMLSNTNNVEIGYYKTQSGALSDIESTKIVNFNAYTIPISHETVYVRFVNQSTACVTVAKIELYAVKIPEPAKEEFEFCDPEQDDVEVVNLSSLNNPLIGNQVFVENTYYLTEEDAIAGSNPINTVEVAPEITIYVNMAIVFEGETLCSNIYPIILKLNLLPLTPIELYVDVCDNYNNGNEYIDLSLWNNLIFSNSQIVEPQFFKQNGELITNPFTFRINGDTVVQVRQRGGDTCFNPVNLNISFLQSITSHDVLQFFCDAYPFDTEELNLVDFLITNQPNLANANLEFYRSSEGAANQTESLKINDPENYVITHSVEILYARVWEEGKCASIIQLALKLKRVPHAYKTDIKVCDIGNDGVENITLSDYVREIFESQSYDIYFYPTESDAINRTNRITQLNLTEPITVYYYAEYGGSIVCYSYGDVMFSLTSTPSSTNKEILICDNNNDTVESLDLTFYNDQLISNPADYQFICYYSEEDALSNTNAIEDPTNATINGNGSIIYVKIINNNNCYSFATLTINFDTAPVAHDVTIGSCDYDYNLIETFNLTSHIDEVIENNENLTIEYYQNYNAAIAQDQNYIIQDPTQYTSYNFLEVVFVRATDPDSGCFSIGKIFIEIYKLPKLIEAKVEVCDTDFDGYYEIMLPTIDAQVIEDTDSYTFQYFMNYNDALNKTNPLNRDEIFRIPDIDYTIYVVVTNEHGCDAISEVSFLPKELTQPALDDYAKLTLCDDDFDGKMTFDLNDIREKINLQGNYELEFYTSIEDAKKAINPIADVSNFINTTNNQLIYVRIEAENLCPIIEHFTLVVYSIPVNPFPEKYEKCPTEYIVLDAGEGISYLWNTGDTTRYITVKDPLLYEVTITNENGCEATYGVQVMNYPYHTVSYVFADDKTVVFSVKGEGSYEFSLNGKDWQASNIFMGLVQGVYNVYVRDVDTGCVVELPFLVFDWFNIITPNGDGMNDEWEECGLEVFGKEMSTLTIFDRYGKAIHSEKSNSCFRWNGKYMGRALPTDTYWFIVTLPDGREFKGYIAIKNYKNDTVR